MKNEGKKTKKGREERKNERDCVRNERRKLGL